MLVDVDQSMRCMREETFGPTLPVMKVQDVEEAIRLANDSTYGLSASVWTRDRARGEQIARRLEAGAVNVNDMFANLFAIPIPQGGWKQSGVGARLGGAHGMRKYCRPQAITTARLTPRSELLWYPYTAARASSANASFASYSQETGAAALAVAGGIPTGRQKTRRTNTRRSRRDIRCREASLNNGHEPGAPPSPTAGNAHPTGVSARRNPASSNMIQRGFALGRRDDIGEVQNLRPALFGYHRKCSIPVSSIAGSTRL